MLFAVAPRERNTRGWAAALGTVAGLSSHEDDTRYFVESGEKKQNKTRFVSEPAAERIASSYLIQPRPLTLAVDARQLPSELTGKVDFVFIDPPYSTHIDYGPDLRDIGKLDAATGDYYTAMDQVFAEIYRVLKPGKNMGLYVSDSYVHGQKFHPLGFELFDRLRQQKFEPIDIISVVRHNKTLNMGNYRKAADEGDFYLRGFNYLFIMQKPATEM